MNSKNNELSHKNPGKLYTWFQLYRRQPFWVKLLIITWVIFQSLDLIFIITNKQGSIVINFSSILISTLKWGSLYLSMAIGLTLTYKLLGFPNFAHAEYLVIGGYTALFMQSLDVFSEGKPMYPLLFILGLVVGFITSGLFAIIVDILVFKPLRDRGASSQVLMISSLGVSLLIKGLLLLRFTPAYRYFDANKEILGGILALPTLRIQFNLGKGFVKFMPYTTYSVDVLEILLIVVTALLVYLLFLFMNKTKMGKAMRAVADNPDLAAASGINVEMVNKISWFIGGGLAGIAGVFYSSLFAFKPETGTIFLLPAFAVIILGTIGSLPGVLIAAYIVGFTRAISEPIFGGLSTPLNRPALTSFREVTAFLLLIFILLFYSEGIGHKLQQKKLDAYRKSNTSKDAKDDNNITDSEELDVNETIKNDVLNSKKEVHE